MGAMPLPDELVASLDAQSDVSGLPAPELAASLIDEGLKTRQFPGIMYRDGPAGRRASLAAGPDVWQIIRALSEVPEDGSDPVETVSIEANLHPAEVRLAMQFHGTYPDEIMAMLDANERAVELADDMIAERERTAEDQQFDRTPPTASRDDSHDLSL